METVVAPPACLSTHFDTLACCSGHKALGSSHRPTTARRSGRPHFNPSSDLGDLAIFPLIQGFQCKAALGSAFRDAVHLQLLAGITNRLGAGLEFQRQRTACLRDAGCDEAAHQGRAEAAVNLRFGSFVQGAIDGFPIEGLQLLSAGFSAGGCLDHFPAGHLVGGLRMARIYHRRRLQLSSNGAVMAVPIRTDKRSRTSHGEICGLSRRRHNQIDTSSGLWFSAIAV